ncbi:MAG: CotH kinase family protein [Bryobacterales bacterium]|nr:CotH kinase family protein [Bryobacterales bacterium]
MKKLDFALLLALGGLLPAQDQAKEHVLFARDEVHEMHLRFEQADWYQQMLRNFNTYSEDAPYIEGSFEWRDVKFAKVGVRIKGNSTARVNSIKKPFRIKFNEFTKGQKIDGIGSINLNNSNMDPSMAREIPYYELAKAAGMKAARMNYAALYVNNEFYGLYLLGEVINDDYIDSHFVKEEGKGWLYKGDIGSTFEDKGEDKAQYKTTYEKKTYEDEDDWSDLIALVAALNRTPDSELAAAVGKVLDIDSFLSAMALDNLTVNLDNYIGMSQNYYIYRRPTDNKFEWIVWDPSLAFGAFSSGMSAAQLKTLSLDWAGNGGIGGAPGGPGLPPGGGGLPGGPGGGRSAARPLVTKLWAIPEIKARYLEIYKRLADEVYDADKLIARFNTLRDLIRPYVERDPNKLHTLQQFDNAMTVEAAVAAPGVPGVPGGAGGPGGSVPAVEPFLRERIASVKAQLAER